jgi:two-component system, NarL family, response regulator NreC
MARLRLLVADDHPIVRHGLRKIVEAQPDWEIVGEASDGQDAVQQTLRLRPDVAIVDIGMPVVDGIEATRQISQRCPDVQVLILSMHADEAYVVRSLQAGAKGYLLKDSAGADLIQAVAAAAQGKSFFSPAVARVMLDDYMRHLAEQGKTDPYESLSERERQIFHLIANGQSNKEIASLLNLSPRTVETHRANILEKLHLHSAIELVLYAVRKGILH